MRTIFDHLRLHAACSPSKPAVLLPDRFVTYDMMVKGIASAQAVLASLRLDRERPVGVLVDLPQRHLLVLLALLKSGYSVCAFRLDQIEIASKVGVTDVLTDRPLPMTTALRGHRVDEKWFQTPPASDEFDAPFPPERIARVMFTSGSTGAPTAIGWSMRALHHRINDMFHAGIGAAPRFLTSLGLSGAGLTCVLRTLWSGNTACFAPMPSLPQAISSMQILEIRAATSQIADLIRGVEQFGRSVRIPLVSLAGAQNAPDLIDAIRRVFGSAVLDTYTSTESGHIGLASDQLLDLRRERGNCFVPVGDVEIVDENGVALPRKREGRIRARTDAMGWPFTGTLDGNRIDRGDGWFYPGDLGTIDEDGLLIVSGRADELINVGGVKFNPELLEDVLKRHPRIIDVAVVRMKAENGDFEAWGAVVLREELGTNALNEWLSRQLPGELVSARLSQLALVDAIPRTRDGKVARGATRKLLTLRLQSR